MLESIAEEIRRGGRDREKTATIHFQVLLNADQLDGMAPADFCREVGIEDSWGVEFHKMIRLNRLMRQQGYTIQKR